MKTFRIVFQLDGTGVVWDPSEPMHFDGLLAWCLAPMQLKTIDAPDPTQNPADIILPLARWHIGGTWGWQASALFPVGERTDSLQFFRKRFREDRADMVSETSVLLKAGAYKTYNRPIPLMLCRAMEAWAVGNRKTTLKTLRKNLRGLGKERARGKGRIVSIDAEYVDESFAMTRDGFAQRYLPAKDGARLVRPRPPYWNLVDRVECCNVGDPWK